MPGKSLDEWLQYQQSIHPREVELGLERVSQVATRLGIDAGNATVITVAGTNGKGSCCALIESILLAHDQQVGCYCSPHLVRYNERVHINGQEATDSDLEEAFQVIEEARGEIPLTFFEFGTLAALWLFQRSGLAFWVLEVGLGGRLDAVNLLDADVAVVTSIDLDHQDWLGGDLKIIGQEKAGISRQGKPLVVAAHEHTEGVVEFASQQGADIHLVGRDFFLDANNGWRFSCGNREFSSQRTAGLPLPSLAAAVCALMFCNGVALQKGKVESVVDSFHLPGRFQKEDLDGITVILDVAHNPAAATLLASRLGELEPSARRMLVLGMVADKDVEGVIKPLLGKTDGWFLSALPGLSRALPAGEMAGIISNQGVEAVTTSESPEQAFARALAEARPGDEVVVAGSFYVVGPVIEKIKKLTGRVS